MVKRIYNGNDVLPPTQAGQIPVAEPNGNGRLVYNPTSVSLPAPGPGDVGKILAINTVTASGVTFKYENLTPLDPMLLTVFNQNGVLLNSNGGLSATFAAKILTLTATAGVFAVFYNESSGIRTSRLLTSGNITIATTGDSTYLFLNPDGTYGQVHSSTDPADFKTVNYLFKVYHPEGGDIVSVKHIYTILSRPQEVLRNYGYGQGLMAQGFHLNKINATTGSVGQVSNYAVVSGYNINPNDNMPSQRIFPAITANPGITFDYWSWVPADRLKAQNSMYLNYKQDVPLRAASSTIPSGSWATVFMYAGSDGSYILMATQTLHATLQEAVNNIFTDLGNMILPQLILEQYDCIAAIVISPPVNSSNFSSNLFIYNLNSLGTSGVAKEELLPDPTTAGVVKVLSGSNAYSIQPDTPTPAVDLTGFVNGDILGVNNGKIAPVKPNAIFPRAGYKEAKRGYFRVVGTTVSHIALDLVNAGITATVSVVPGGQQIVFSGVNNFWLHGGIYEDANGQHHFNVIAPNSGQAGNLPSIPLLPTALAFVNANPRTFDDNTQGFEFLIYFFLL